MITIKILQSTTLDKDHVRDRMPTIKRGSGMFHNVTPLSDITQEYDEMSFVFPVKTSSHTLRHLYCSVKLWDMYQSHQQQGIPTPGAVNQMYLLSSCDSVCIITYQRTYYLYCGL